MYEYYAWGKISEMREINPILTDAEYMAQGFTAEECPKIRRHDELFNRYINSQYFNIPPLTEEEDEEMSKLVKELGL
jgi:hypothetical protein